MGKQIRPADWRLFTRLIRFDAVYFKGNQRRFADYQNLTHIRRHYCFSHHRSHPHAIVPKGPVLAFTLAHQWARFKA